MGYISDLRKYVGNKPLIGVGATVLIYNDKDEILLNLKTDTNTWGLPGGAMELYESIEDTARREIYEETGLILEELSYVKILSGEEFFYKYPNGDELCNVIVLYKSRKYYGNLQIRDGESSKLKFFDINELPELETRCKIILDKIKSKEIKI